MEYQDYYARLGVPRDADPETIKRAYRSMARRFHPDVNPDDPEAERVFKEINEAYAVLSDPEKRRRYDHLGAAWQQAQSQGAHFHWSEWFRSSAHDRAGGQQKPRQTQRGGKDPSQSGGASDSASFSEFFQALFGGGGERKRRRSNRSKPTAPEQLLPVEITLEEAFWGTTRQIQQGDTRYQVEIPKGVDTGAKVRISLDPNRGGNLHLLVTVKPHSRFHREQADLHLRLSVDLYTMLLGGSVEVPTLQGAVLLTIPPNTQNGRIFRLAGQGMPHLHQPQQRGDLYVETVAELPVPLNEEERARFLALQRMRERGRPR